jgi:hypothetical protein
MGFISHTLFNLINNNMKPDYREKVLSNFESMNKRITDLVEMLNGTRPGDDKVAKAHLMELQRLLENSETLVSVS